MATKASIISSIVVGATLSTITFSGTVTLSAAGVSRDILIYKKGLYTIPWQTTSDLSGNWSISVPGGSNDFFLIICLGDDSGENSEIYDWVQE